MLNVSEEFLISIYENVMKYSRNRKEMELKCLCLAILQLLARFMFSFVLLDVNSCHAFLIRNVIRSDATMMMSFPWDLQTFHFAS